jgi:hypothetical protein
VRIERHTTQVTKPTNSGSRSVARAWYCTAMATPPSTATTASRTNGCHHDRRARCPAQPKSRPSTTNRTATRKGLSLEPRMLIACSTTGPGVSRMTSSATATTGDSRIDIAIAAK